MSTEEAIARDTVIAEGEAAPGFTLPDQDRKDFVLADALERGPVVLSFFPFAFTSVCEAEMMGIQTEMEAWKAKGAEVVGISCDSPAALRAWADQQGFTQRLLSDLHRSVCKAYGLYWMEKNVAARGTVIVGRGPEGEPVVKWSQGRAPSQAMDLGEVLGKLA